jgi:hypothetical protein
MAKELRVLLLPWSVALAIAIVLPAANFLVSLHYLERGNFLTFVVGLVTFAFFGCLLAIAALPFGTEFLHKTFPLVLSQPVSRAQIWKDKLIAGSGAVVIPVVVLVLVQFTAQAASGFILRRRGGEVSGLNAPWEMALSAVALLLPTLGSVGYWTLLARSTLGGIVFTAFAQLIFFGLLAFISGQPDAGPAFFGVIGVLYGAVFFLLSWRKFAGLELSHVSPGDSLGANSLTARPSGLAWLRCRPTSGIFNLVRKEIQLQRPLFIIAIIMLTLWLLTYAWQLLEPTRKTHPEIIFALTIGFYIPLVSFLAGSISLGEEKNLAIVGWHLSFPISVRRQWAVKLAVGFGTWVLLGLLLPFCLTRVGEALGGPRIFNEAAIESWLPISLFMTHVYAFSFWAMTLFSNTVRAVIGGLVTVMALCGAGALASWFLAEFVFPQPLVRTLLVYDSHLRDAYGWVLIGATTVVLAFIQSLLQFRLLQTSWRTVVKYSGMLVAFVFFATICYFSILPFTPFCPAIYLLLFALLLIFVRRMAVPQPARADSLSQ